MWRDRLKEGFVRGSDAQSTEERARRRAKYLSGLVWHAGTFIIINAFFWILDLGVGESGVDWAFWITAAWGLGLAFHVLAYIVDGRQLEERKTRRYLEDDTRFHPG